MTIVTVRFVPVFDGFYHHNTRICLVAVLRFSDFHRSVFVLLQKLEAIFRVLLNTRKTWLLFMNLNLIFGVERSIQSIWHLYIQFQLKKKMLSAPLKED